MMFFDEEMFNLMNYFYLNLSNKWLFFIVVDWFLVYLGYVVGVGRLMEYWVGGGVVWFI